MAHGEKIIQVGAPFIILLGVFGNIVVFVVLNRMKHHFEAFSSFFKSLVVADSCILLFCLLPRWIAILLDPGSSKGQLWFNYLHTWTYFAAITASSWLLAAMIVVRALGCVAPQRIKSKRVARVCQLAIVFLTLIPCILAFFVLEHVDFTRRSPGIKVVLLSKVWAWVYFFLAFLLPFLVIAASNTVLLVAVRASSQKLKGPSMSDRSLVRTQEDVTSTSGDRAKQKKERNPTDLRRNSMVILLSLSSISFCVLMMPKCLTDALLASDIIPEDGLPSWALQLFELFIYTNAAIKFFIYCFTGANFRREIVKVFVRVKRYFRRQTGTDKAKSLEGSRTTCTASESRVISWMYLPSKISTTSRVSTTSNSHRKSIVSYGEDHKRWGIFRHAPDTVPSDEKQKHIHISAKRSRSFEELGPTSVVKFMPRRFSQSSATQINTGTIKPLLMAKHCQPSTTYIKPDF